ncbi:Mannose 6-phosphate receptor-like protein 1 [Spathaspora sp. JA1]|nr:Mannose 6-phosphate receptor-like protein 1 [Spathaspora sp. JA1]
MNNKSIMKLLRRVTLPLLTLTLIICITVIQTNKPKGNDIYKTGTQIFDSISHFTFTKEEDEGENILPPTQQQQQQQKQPQEGHVEQEQASSPQQEEIPEQQPINQVPEINQATQQQHEEKPQSEEEKLDPCTIINPLTKQFIDLRGLSSFANDGKALPWNTRGYDSGRNYTLGICSNPFKKYHDSWNEIQDGLDPSKIGAYYIDSTTNKYVSMGEYSTTPVFRGRKLTLTYENGAYCDVVDSKTGKKLQKSTILTFTCDRELMDSKAHISFVGQMNNCSYFFEVRSHDACPTAPKTNESGAIWIFLLIVLAALLVYFSGGLLYKQIKKKPGREKSYSS